MDPVTGYGRMTVNKQARGAHRRSYELHKGPIPDGKCVLHTCDVRDCVRPDHLFLGSYADNHHDMIAKGRNQRGEKHAKAKVTEADVMAIRADTRLLREIASDYGIHLSVAWNIKNRVTWKHVA